MAALAIAAARPCYNSMAASVRRPPLLRDASASRPCSCSLAAAVRRTSLLTDASASSPGGSVAQVIFRCAALLARGAATGQWTPQAHRCRCWPPKRKGSDAVTVVASIVSKHTMYCTVLYKNQKCDLDRTTTFQHLRKYSKTRYITVQAVIVRPGTEHYGTV